MLYDNIPGYTTLDFVESVQAAATTNSQGQLVVLSPCSIGASCCCCGYVVVLHFVATEDAAIVVDNLITTARLNLFCTRCVADLKRARDGRQ
ncbi:E7 [Miniopterus schreibersii papillomavirus 1]|uniref:E7 n=1 Tax=Miniopterus schreibersii papillomavirus 1 TaxID=1195364 RepID=J9R1H9_9PAPI|nr:E7 [Miniopterus schreibersii papillomavirus 1]AFR33944.1 E7 [Miniopterus schreibersii papillomavirus 1]